MLTKIEAASRKLNRRLAVGVSGFLMLAVTFLLTADAFRRTVFGNPILGTIEISETIMAWIIFIAVAYALVTDTHVRVVLVLNRLPPRVRSKFEIFSNIVGFSFFAILTYQSSLFFWESWVLKTVPMAPLGVPLWIATLALPIGSALISVQFLILITRLLRPARMPREEKEEIWGV